jgi:hypothetical protein
MTFTGTLIEDLFAAVERAEQLAQPEPQLITDSWFASVQENTEFDSHLPMWHESGVA